MCILYFFQMWRSMRGWQLCCDWGLFVFSPCSSNFNGRQPDLQKVRKRSCYHCCSTRKKFHLLNFCRTDCCLNTAEPDNKVSGKPRHESTENSHAEYFFSDWTNRFCMRREQNSRKPWGTLWFLLPCTTIVPTSTLYTTFPLPTMYRDRSSILNLVLTCTKVKRTVTREK